MKRILLLGSTGSVGRQTLDLVRENPDTLCVVGLSAGENDALLAEQLLEFEPAAFAVADAAAGQRLLARLPGWRGQCAGLGSGGVCALAAQDADIVVNALLGYAGLEPTLAALARGTDVALANKETMVVAGELVRRTADASGARLIPIDSEHSALEQCLRAGRVSEVRRLILTASGGPFRMLTLEEMQHVTPFLALKHPTWSMGRKITVDSATLMNKGFEILEARWLFDVEFERIEVLVHPQSIVHSMVEFRDGAVMAQMGTTDMRLPIWYALHAPERPALGLRPLDLAQIGMLTFEPLDRERFPCVGLAEQAGLLGGTCPAILNAANEVAVAAFLDERLDYLGISQVLRSTLEELHGFTAAGADLTAVRAADTRARDVASQHIVQRLAAGCRPC